MLWVRVMVRVRVRVGLVRVSIRVRDRTPMFTIRPLKLYTRVPIFVMLEYKEETK